MDILGGMWSGICPDEDKGVMAGVAGIKTHPLATWVISILRIFCLGGGVGYLCWGCDMLEKGRWGGVDQSIAIFHVWVNDVGEYGNETEVREVVEGFISDGDRMHWFTATAHNSDGIHKVVSPVFDNVEWDRVSHAVTQDASCQFLHVAHLFFTWWDAMFVIRGRWGDRGDGRADGF